MEWKFLTRRQWTGWTLQASCFVKCLYNGLYNGLSLMVKPSIMKCTKVYALIKKKKGCNSSGGTTQAAHSTNKHPSSIDCMYVV